MYTSIDVIYEFLSNIRAGSSLTIEQIKASNMCVGFLKLL